MTLPTVTVVSRDVTERDGEYYLDVPRVLVNGVEVFKHPLGPRFDIRTALWQSQWLQEYPRRKDDRLRARLTVVDESPYHCRLFILEQEEDEPGVRLVDIISSRYHVTDLLPIVINPHCAGPQHKVVDHIVRDDNFYDGEAVLQACIEREEGSVWLMDPKTTRLHQILTREQYAEYRGRGNTYEPRLRFVEGRVLLDFHFHFSTFVPEIAHSVDITEHLQGVEFDPAKTAQIHAGVVRAYPPVISEEVAMRAMAEFYAGSSDEG